MYWQYTPFIIFIFITLLISGTLFIWGLHLRPISGAAWFAALMFAAFLFSLFYGLEILAVDLEGVIFWSKIQYLGAANIPVTWLFLVMTYTGRRDKFTARKISLFFIIPVITILLAWTNQFHELIWITPTLKSNPAFTLLTFTPGIWWWVNMVYGGLILTIAVAQLIATLIYSNSIYLRQIIVLLVFSGLNGLGSVVYIMDMVPYNINPAPLTISVGGLLLAWGIFRYHIIELIPIAKDKIIDGLRDGLIVLNTKNKVVDINPMARMILGISQASITGRPISDIVSAYPELEEKLCRNGTDSSQHVEITFDVKRIDAVGIYNFAVHITPLKDKRGRVIGRLLFLYDITERVKQKSATDMLLSITQEVGIAQDFRDAVNKTLELILKQAKWTFGEAWTPNRDQSQLENVDASYCNGSNVEQLERFNQASLQFSFSRNKGLPGRVWASKEIEWKNDISVQSREIYHRLDFAKEANLKTSLGIPILDEEGEVVVVLIFYMDQVHSKDQYMLDLISVATAQLGAVLQNKRAEEVMRIQSATLEASSSGIVITNRKGKITWANPAFSQLTGYSMAEIMGETPRIFNSGQQSPEFYAQLWKRILSGEAWEGEIVNRRKDGSFYVEEQSITPTRNRKGEITHFIAIKHDVSQRKWEKEKIQRQNSFLNSIIESVASPFYVINVADYSIEIANSAARALGADRMYTCYALTHGRETPCDGRIHPCPLQIVQNTKSPAVVEHIHVDAEGNPVQMEVHGYPILDEAGDVVQMIEYSLDITERKLADRALKASQEQLQKSEARYRLLADNSTDVIWMMGLDMHFTYISPSVQLQRGYTVEEAMEFTLEQTLPPISLQKARETFAELMISIRKSNPEERRTILRTVEVENYCKDGSTIWVETTMSLLFNVEGKSTEVIGASRNISERKKAEEELRKLSRAVEQSGNTIVVTDLEGTIEFANPAFTRITGYTLDEAIGTNTRLLNSGEHPPEFYRELWETIAKNEVWQGEMINRKKSGELYWEAATISPVQDQDGKTTHYLAIKEDISERKAIEAALAQEQEKTDTLLKNILPEEVAEEIKQRGKVAPVLYENISILFTDFRNFTISAEILSPNELVELIDYYFTAFDRIIEKYSIEKLKTIGDSYMCASGLPRPNKNHAVDITCAALDMVDFVEKVKKEHQEKGVPFWDIRVGISSGSVVAGIVGKKKYAYDIWGDSVVMAARMEQSGEVNKINISETTYEHVKDHFECQSRGEVAAKNKGMVKMYFVSGVKEGFVEMGQ